MTLPLSYSRLHNISPCQHVPQQDRSYDLKLPVAGLPNQRLNVGGEGRIRTSEATRATDLQSVAFDRSATSPKSNIVRRQVTACRTLNASQYCYVKLSLSFYRMVSTSITDPNLLNRPAPVRPVRTSDRPPAKNSLEPRPRCLWSWRRDLNPRPADYKSAALPS